MDDHDDGDARALARELRVVVGRMRRRLDEAAQRGELTASQASLLSRLAKFGPATASALAAAEHVRPQSIAATVQALEERGLVHRSADAADGRRLLVALTADGTALFDDRSQAREGWLAERFRSSYTPAERAELLHALGLLHRLTGDES